MFRFPTSVILSAVCLLGLASEPCRGDEPLDEEAVKSAFEAAKVAHKEKLTTMAKRGASGGLDAYGKKRLAALRQAKTVKPDVEWKKGSIGYLGDAVFQSKSGPMSAEIKIYSVHLEAVGNRAVPRSSSRGATLKGFDPSASTPGDRIENVAVILEDFDGGDAIYRVIDLKPFEAKYGKLK